MQDFGHDDVLNDEDGPRIGNRHVRLNTRQSG